jgi:uncharacterized protein YpbB
MNFIYVAKKDCRYIWSTVSSTSEECILKIKQQLDSLDYHQYVVCLVELKDIERTILF